MKVYLDDYRTPPAGFVLARDAEACMLLLDTGEVELLSLDYDLGWGNPSGLDVARHMVSKGLYPARIYMHSSSMSGRAHMYNMLRESLPAHALLFSHPVPADLLLQIEQAYAAQYRKKELSSE